ncbi:hypothetical protein TIFTF001_013408 [Ficus carica]|uniref:Uncharacterized protein n=1 Tax=Ficus carica TaxID=3494 RepID=A0AA88DI92_FICCA|nr:hypothetical protein TIFTF001_013408 [Ficus carica]
MAAVYVSIKYNGKWDITSIYVDGEMKRIMMPLTATYVGLIELVWSVIELRGQEKTIVMKDTIELGMPSVRIQSDAGIHFYIQPKKKDGHVLSEFSISIDLLDGSVAEAIFISTMFNCCYHI